MQCVDLSGVLFVLHETALFALCPVPNALFPATWIYFSRPRWVPKSPCDVTSFAPLPFSAPPTTLIDDAVTLPKACVAAAFKTWYLTFWQYTLLKEFHTFFVVWKQEPSEHFGRQTISAYYAVPEVSCRDDACVFNFVLVSPGCYYKRMYRVITTMFLPHVWKALNLNVKNKPMQLHVQKCFSHRSVEDVRNQCQLLELHLCSDTGPLKTVSASCSFWQWCSTPPAGLKTNAES
jgi:hypothetical protein